MSQLNIFLESDKELMPMLEAVYKELQGLGYKIKKIDDSSEDFKALIIFNPEFPTIKIRISITSYPNDSINCNVGATGGSLARILINAMSYIGELQFFAKVDTASSLIHEVATSLLEACDAVNKTHELSTKLSSSISQKRPLRK